MTYLLVRAEPRHVITALLVKFSEAISSIPLHWRNFSFSIRSNMTGSCSSRDRHPGSVVGIDIFAFENSELSSHFPQGRDATFNIRL